jgi:membrane protease YdiL (CAAX protease family)
MFARLRELDGAVVFVILTLGLTLASAWICVPLAADIEPDAGAMLRASVLYVAVIGWQPVLAFAVAQRLFADRRPFDGGVRPVARRDSLFAIAVALFVLGTAAVLARSEPSTMLGPALPSVARVVVAIATIVGILWLQAIVEELAFRGYLLPRLMRSLGPWPGLVVHGIVWGLCYAPLFAVGGDSVTRSLRYVVTCALLGIVLGWLRLATRSIFASAASNATLTICAGLPLVLVGESSPFSATFGPPGWLPLLVVIALIAAHRPWRSSITVPWR